MMVTGELGLTPLHVRAQTIGKVGNEEYTQLLRKIDIDIFSRP